MTFYVDLIYLSCTAVNFIILGFHSKFLSVRIKKTKLLLGAALGGLLSLQSIVLKSNLIVIFGETLLILRIVYGNCTFAELIRRFFILVGVVLVFGAVANMFSVFYSGIFLKDNRLYGVLPVFAFVLSGALAAMIVFVFLFFTKHRKILYRVEMVIDGETINTTAFLDTGNRLREPKSKRPVIIIEDAILQGEHSKESIFLKTVGNERESIDMVYVKSLTLLDENREFYDLYAGIAEHSLSKNGEFHALLHSEFAN